MLFGLGEERTVCKNKKAMGKKSEHNNYTRMDDKKECTLNTQNMTGFILEINLTATYVLHLQF